MAKIRTKDGIKISGIPDGMPLDDPQVKAQVAKMRASGQKEATFTPIVTDPRGNQARAEGMDGGEVPQPAAAPPNPNAQYVTGNQAPPAPAVDPFTMPSNQMGFGIGLQPHQPPQGGKPQPSAGILPNAAQFKDQLPHDVGAASRGIAQGLLTVPAYLTDALSSIANLALPDELKAKPFNEVLNMLMTKGGVPEAETKGQKLLQAGASGLFSAAGGKLAGDLLQYAPGAVEVAKATATNPAIMQQISRIPSQIPGKLTALSQSMQAALGAQAISGAGAESTIELARQKGASPLVQAGLGMAAGTALGIPSSLKHTPIGPGPVQDAAAVGGRLLTSDVFPPRTPFFKAAQAIAEKIPVTGTGGIRKGAQARRIEMIEELVQQYDASDLPQISSAVSRSLIGGRADKMDRFKLAKAEVIDRLSFPKAGTTQELIGGPKLITGKTASDLSRIVPMPLTTQKIDDSIAMLQGLKNPQIWDPYIKKMEGWKASIEGQDLRNIEINRKPIGDEFAASDNKSVKAMGKQLVTGTESEPGIYAFFNEDMGNFIKKNGSQVDYDKWKTSNKSISLLMKELDDGILQTVLEQGKANPEVMQRMLFSKYKSDIDQLYRNLDEEGRANAVSAIISRATNRLGDNFSPDKVVAEFAKLKPQVGIFMQGKGKDQIEGFIRYLKMTERNGQFAAMPPNGVQAVVPLGALGLGALGQQQAKGIPGLVGTIVTSASLGIIPRIIESKSVRNMLINLGKVKEGSKEAQELFAAIMASIQSTGKAERNQYMTKQEEDALADER